jgi:hypothetical protein
MLQRVVTWIYLAAEDNSRDPVLASVPESAATHRSPSPTATAGTASTSTSSGSGDWRRRSFGVRAAAAVDVSAEAGLCAMAELEAARAPTSGSLDGA